MNNYLNMFTQLILIVVITSWTIFMLSKLEKTNKLIIKAKKNEKFLYNCAQIKVTINNIKDANSYLCSTYPKYKKKFSGKTEQILTIIEEKNKSDMCVVSDNKKIIIAYAHKQLNKSLPYKWPNWTVKYKRIKK
jgi:hypothetical protein